MITYTQQQVDDMVRQKELELKQGIITLRDQFAMAALSSSVPQDIIEVGLQDGQSHDRVRQAIANYCYSVADAMMKARGE